MLSFDDPSASATSASHKRPRALAQAQQGAEQESTTDPKRQCGGDRKVAIKPRKTSASTSPPPKEPQSDAAKVSTLMVFRPKSCMDMRLANSQ
jgi:hypothetical protein